MTDEELVKATGDKVIPVLIFTRDDLFERARKSFRLNSRTKEESNAKARAHAERMKKLGCQFREYEADEEMLESLERSQ